MRVYKGKMEARSEGISFYTFLRISPRKINIFKRAKLHPTELNELYNMNIKKILLDIMNILKSTIKMSKKKNEIKKRCSKFSRTKICYRALQNK